ncbi:MAG: aromatic-ring-hydroxylating dioxygenase subunit beta [Burkholderiaceae bacterium]|nr:aromatic-ring-hydroxylating dioxygenase subunit beta [Desulfobacterales bacterium]MDP3136838.1 aromatic-ring-hydroxylating dioxygenase subunit beta [Burkholderiaceae bacterium]
MKGTVTRASIEDFLYAEAALLDEWKLMEWAELFTEDAQYLVPATDAPDGDPRTTLFLIYDDRHRLAERAKRLLNKNAHAEFPHSQTQHNVSNVRFKAVAESDEIEVHCNFVVYRSKGEVNNVYPGHSIYRLVPAGDTFRIRQKRSVLNAQALRPEGKVSIIL